MTLKIRNIIAIYSVYLPLLLMKRRFSKIKYIFTVQLYQPHLNPRVRSITIFVEGFINVLHIITQLVFSSNKFRRTFLKSLTFFVCLTTLMRCVGRCLVRNFTVLIFDIQEMLQTKNGNLFCSVQNEIDLKSKIVKLRRMSHIARRQTKT